MMNDSPWRRARDIFEQAIEMDESLQTAFVHRACGVDQPLLAEVKRMINADRRHSPLLDQPILVWVDTKETLIDKNLGAGPPFDYIGNYRLIRKLGEGGMGKVYLAVEEPVDRQVAIKLMRAGLDANYLRRFNDERKALASLNQRNIVTMFASGAVDDRPYFVMEYLDGESLKERMLRGLIPLQEIVEITGQICEALNAAHNRQIVHRDIKPDNIFLSRDDDGLLVKILDFGIATLKESETRTTTNAIVGTAAYLSPEQARGINRKEIDGRADIYTLGVVVYEMLTGIRPFTASNTAGYQHLHLNVMPERPSKRISGDGVTEAVSDVVMKALAKDPRERHQTAREFARELKEAAEEDLPPPVPLNAEPFTRPRKAYISRNVLFLAIVLLLLGAVGWWAASHFNQSPGTAVIGNSSNRSGGGQRNPANGQPGGSSPNVTNSQTGSGVASGINSQANLPGIAGAPSVSPSAPAMGPELKVELEQEGKGIVLSESIFRSGDAVRLIASPNQSGRVYIVMKGTVGPVEILYPDSRIKGSGAVQANQRIEMPPSKSERPWFKFDNKPGVETLYIVFAGRKGDERLQPLESAVRQKRRQFNAIEEKQIVAALDALAAGQSTSPNVTAKKILLRHEK
jgi:serine/threonine protein kinase